MEKTLLTAPLSLTEIAPELPTFTDKFKGARRCNATRGPFAIECCDANFRYAKLIWIKRDPNILHTPQILPRNGKWRCKRWAACVCVALLLFVLDQSPSAMNIQASKILRAPRLASREKVAEPIKSAPRRPENPARPMGARHVSG